MGLGSSSAVRTARLGSGLPTRPRPRRPWRNATCRPLAAGTWSCTCPLRRRESSSRTSPYRAEGTEPPQRRWVSGAAPAGARGEEVAGCRTGLPEPRSSRAPSVGCGRGGCLTPAAWRTSATSSQATASPPTTSSSVWAKMADPRVRRSCGSRALRPPRRPDRRCTAGPSAAATSSSSRPRPRATAGTPAAPRAPAPPGRRGAPPTSRPWR
mmetsp:Transcript_178637/g.572667  ORF Transcript_178637/g.572667 Transcript_178637/m.572667 type:complete len:211 (-) Transcript_178637:324-956(-)